MAEGAEESKDSIFEHEDMEDSGKYPFIHSFFGLPLIVIGCKADLIPNHDAAAIRDARDLQGQIRGTSVTGINSIVLAELHVVFAAMCIDVGLL